MTIYKWTINVYSKYPRLWSACEHTDEGEAIKTFKERAHSEIAKRFCTRLDRANLVEKLDFKSTHQNSGVLKLFKHGRQ